MKNFPPNQSSVANFRLAGQSKESDILPAAVGAGSAFPERVATAAKIAAPCVLMGVVAFFVTACSQLEGPSRTETKASEPQGRPSWTHLQTHGTWSYQHTYDKLTRLGRSSDALSISREGTTAYFRIPKGFRFKSCADEPLDWNFEISSDKDDFYFGVSLEKPSSTYQSYLSAIHGTHDDKVQMAPAPSFKLHDGSEIVPYGYSSKYWGHRLVVIIPKGKVSTKFEFSARSKAELTRKRDIMRSVIESFRYEERQ